MGQPYIVEGLFKFKENDPSEFCKIIKDYIEQKVANGGMARPTEMDICDFSDPKACFKLITCGPQRSELYFDRREDGEWWCTDFDATYSWCTILCEVFSKAIECLEDGSTVKIMPESGYLAITASGGEAQTEWHDEEDDEEDDE